LPKETIARLIERARKGGIEIVDLLGSSAYYAPAAGVVKMAEAIITDSRGVIPCCAYCQKEYNVGGYFVGVPVVLGKAGVEKIVELNLNADERKELDVSVSHVKDLVAKVDKLL
jgi:malate dehydrogenase